MVVIIILHNFFKKWIVEYYKELFHAKNTIKNIFWKQIYIMLYIYLSLENIIEISKIAWHTYAKFQIRIAWQTILKKLPSIMYYWPHFVIFFFPDRNIYDTS